MKRNLLKYATVLGMGGLVVSLLIGGINPETGFPDPITVNGETIEFTWTDDNADEDLIIYTDKATYTNGIAHAEVYVAVENRTGRDQNIELMGYFRDSKQRIKDISVLTEVTTEEPVFAIRQVCEDITIKATTTKKTDIIQNVCTDYQDQVSTTTVTNAVWRPLATLARTDLEKNLEATKLVEKTRKPVEGFIAEKKSSLFTLPTGGVAYYKVLVEFPAATNDNFYFEALGDHGGYGHLDPWFDTDWNYRVSVTVESSAVPANQTSFPVYVDLSDLPAEFHTNVKADGCDIRVVEADETTETAFELVSYATSTDTGELHFMADSISSTTDSVFYIYYGNSAASCYAVTDTYGRNAVWTGLAAKWHLSESSGNATDSTGNGNTATNVNTATYTSSQMYNGVNVVRASSQHLDATDSASLAILGDNTVSFWVYFTSLPTSGQVFGLVTKDTAGASNREWWADVYNPSASYQLRFGIHSTGVGSRVSYSYITYAFSTATWYKVDIKTTVANAVGTKFEFFVNGVSQGNGTAADIGGANTSIVNGTNPVVMGGYNAAGVYHNGRLDEVSIIGSLLSTTWIRTKYNNQSDPSTFYTVGAQESNGAAPAPSVEDSAWFN